MTFEEAKQKVAEKYTCSNWEELFFSSLSFEVDKYYSEAAELWQQSNLERINELEDELKDLIQQCDTLAECEIPNTEYAKQLLK